MPRFQLGGEYISVDGSTRALNIIDYDHHEIHEGSAYFLAWSGIVNDTGVLELRIQTGNTEKWAHMEVTIDGALAGIAQLWEGTTKTHNASNAITPFNRNRNSSNTSLLTICHTPSGTESAAAGLTQYFGATASGGRVAVGGGASSRAEIILKQNTAYLIRATSAADGNRMAIILDWYEHTYG